MSGRRRPGGSGGQRARRQAGEDLQTALGVAGITVSRQVLARLARAYVALRSDLETLRGQAGCNPQGDTPR